MQGSQPKTSENQPDEDIVGLVTKPVYIEGTKRQVQKKNKSAQDSEEKVTKPVQWGTTKQVQNQFGTVRTG